MVINYKNWVWVTLVLRLLPSRGGEEPPREGKSPGNKVCSLLTVCKQNGGSHVASEDEEIESLIKIAVSRGASLRGTEKASISLICCN